MTAPIDIDCPTCKVTAGRYCVSDYTIGGDRIVLSFHHAARVDAAMRQLRGHVDARCFAAATDRYVGLHIESYIEAMPLLQIEDMTVEQLLEENPRG